MHIPRILHQTWKNDVVPERWRKAVAATRRMHPGWEYILWTDATMDEHVRKVHPELYPIYAGFPKNIMRSDVFRYIVMHDMGGMYCDLDYEFLRPYDYGDARLLLSEEFSVAYGDTTDYVANYIFASEPRHALWVDILDDIQRNVPTIAIYDDVPLATGPGLITRVFFANRARYEGVRLTGKPVFSPTRMAGSLRGEDERKILRNADVTYGIHLGSGSWKERWSLSYMKIKLAKLFRGR